MHTRDDILETLADSQLFSTLDLASGYGLYDNPDGPDRTGRNDWPAKRKQTCTLIRVNIILFIAWLRGYQYCEFTCII